MTETTTESRRSPADVSRPLQGEDIPWHARLRVLAIWLGLLIFITLILVVRLPFSGQVTLDVGDVAAARRRRAPPDHLRQRNPDRAAPGDGGERRARGL